MNGKKRNSCCLSAAMVKRRQQFAEQAFARKFLSQMLHLCGRTAGSNAVYVLSLGLYGIKSARTK
jgi:hypothetical protein